MEPYTFCKLSIFLHGQLPHLKVYKVPGVIPTYSGKRQQFVVLRLLPHNQNTGKLNWLTYILVIRISWLHIVLQESKQVADSIYGQGKTSPRSRTLNLMVIFLSTLIQKSRQIGSRSVTCGEIGDHLVIQKTGYVDRPQRYDQKYKPRQKTQRNKNKL